MPEDVKKETVEKEREEEEETEESPDTSELLKKDVAELATILSKNPEIGQHVREIMDYHLKGGIDRTTLKTVMGSIDILLGTSATRIILASCAVNKDKFFDDLGKDGEGAVQDKGFPFLRHLAALYGSKMEEAYHLTRGIPEDWRHINVALYREEEEEKVWFIDANLTKYNGEKIFLKMPPASAFNLAQNLLEGMEKIPKEAIDEEVIKVFRERTEGFKKKFLSGDDDRD